jgi:hypothetical protein
LDAVSPASDCGVIVPVRLLTDLRARAGGSPHDVEFDGEHRR